MEADHKLEIAVSLEASDHTNTEAENQSADPNVEDSAPKQNATTRESEPNLDIVPVSSDPVDVTSTEDTRRDEVDEAEIEPEVVGNDLVETEPAEPPTTESNTTPQDVEVEIKPQVAFTDPQSAADIVEIKDTNGSPQDPSSEVNISKMSTEQVTGRKLGEADPEAESSMGKSDKENEKEPKRKLIPIWRLFRYADCWDILMILFGAVLALAAGVALPGNMLLFGLVINEFVSFAIVSSIIGNMTAGSPAMPQGSCINATNPGTDAIVQNIASYFENPGPTLQYNVGLFSIYYVALGTGVLLAIFFSTVFWNVSAQRQTKRIRLAFYRAILRQEMGWFDVNEASELNTRLVDDIEKIQSGLGDKISLFLQYVSQFLTGFVIAFSINWKMALVVSVMLPILVVLVFLIAIVIATFSVREQNAYAAAGAVAEEVLSSIRTVVAFGGEAKETERYGDKLKSARNEGFKKAFLSSLISAILYFIIFATYALGFGYGSLLVANCELATGDTVTVLFSVVVGSFSLGNALPEIETFSSALGSATVIYEIIDREPLIDSFAEDGIVPEQIEGNIKFSDVVFHYPSRPDVQILHGLDLEINKGHTVALVGPSGCGKSTVMQLIQRLYDPVGGLVTIDGHELKSLNLRWLRNNIGIVSQEPSLFNATIAENIRYGKADATLDEIIEAAKNSNAHDFISELPEGYDTHVGERGAQLSGGQKQRIAIARALVRKPLVLLLDEATSALDTESEKIVQDALDKAREGRTTIVIAHRLSTIRTADIIVSLEKGRVVEMGSHDDLMDKKGLYYELVSAQTIVEEEHEPQMKGFKEAVHRSISIRQDSIRSRKLRRQSSFDEESSLRSRRYSGRRLSENASRFTTEDLPFASAPSAFPGRSAFPGINDVIVDIDEEEEEEETVVKYEGSAVVMDNSQEASTPKKKKKPSSVSFWELFKLNKPDWCPLLFGIIGAGLLGVLFPLISLVFSQILAVLGLPDPVAIRQEIVPYIVGFIALAIGAGLIQFVSTFFLSIAGERLTKRLRYRSFQAMLRQEIAWFDKKVNSTGALTTKLATDASEVKGATGIRLGVILQQMFGLVAALLVSFTASWELTLLLILCFPIIILFGYLEIRLVVGRAIKNKKKMEAAGQIAVESIDNIRTVVSLAVEFKYFERYQEQIEGPFKNNIKNVFVQGIVLALGQSIIFYLYAAGYSFGAYLVILGRNSYDQIFLVFSAMVFTALSIGRACSFASDASRAKISANRIFALLHRTPLIDSTSSDGQNPDTIDGDIDIHDVFFNYPERPEVKILQGLSISVKPGQTLALVGPSGCGKSTSVSLIERFYDPASGSISLDGTHLQDLNIKWLRSAVGLVGQEPVLFDATIAENIRYGALFREVSDEEVIAAAKSANIHSFIETLPMGYNTNVGAKGTQLSGGQKQRIAIARALVRDPKILLLDEATSALDTESEKIVQDALDKAREGRTSIVIAHRLSTVYNSDVIAVIHHGQVIESGTHSELMALGGAYHHLNTVQLRNVEE